MVKSGWFTFQLHQCYDDDDSEKGGLALNKSWCAVSSPALSLSPQKSKTDKQTKRKYKKFGLLPRS